MRRGVPTVLLVVFFALLQAWLGARLDRGTAPVKEASALWLAGAVRPVLVQFLWLETEAALHDRRYFDAMDRLRLLEVADPGNWRASSFRAFVLAHDVAGREPGPTATMSRVLEAASILERAAATTGEPDPSFALGQMLLEPRFWDPRLSGPFERARHMTPREAGAAALDEALRRAPGSRVVRLLAVDGWRLTGLETLIRGGDQAKATQALLVAAEIARGGVAQGVDLSDSTGATLALAWSDVLSGVPAGAPDLAARADRLAVALERLPSEDAGGDDFEFVFAAALPRLLLEAAMARVQAASADDVVLSQARAMHRIRALVGRRLGARNRQLLTSMVDYDRWGRLLESLAAVPKMATDAAALRAELSAWSR